MEGIALVVIVVVLVAIGFVMMHSDRREVRDQWQWRLEECERALDAERQLRASAEAELAARR